MRDDSPTRDGGAVPLVGPLAPFSPMVGIWVGRSEGVFGATEVEKRGQFVLGGKFFQIASRSVSDDEVHEDIGIFSFDEEAGTLVLREFHIGGYVNTYREVESEDDSLVFESEQIENPPSPTLRARISLWPGDDRLRETLELASGEEPLSLCVDARLARPD